LRDGFKEIEGIVLSGNKNVSPADPDGLEKVKRLILETCEKAREMGYRKTRIWYGSRSGDNQRNRIDPDPKLAGRAV